MSQSSNITIAILAAGASTRMGSPKQLLKWGNKSLITHTISIAQNSKAKEVIVVLGANSETITSEIKGTSASILINKEWHKGIGKSIACAADHILNSNEKCKGILVILADQPFVTTDYLNEIIEVYTTEKANIIATAYHSNKLGVPALFDRVYFEELSQLSGDDGAKSLIKKDKHVVTVLSSNFTNVDIDTKADFKQYSKGKFN